MRRRPRPSGDPGSLLYPIGFIFFVLGMWELSIQARLVDRFYVSSPIGIFTQILNWLSSGYIYRHILITLGEALLGFVIGGLLGVLFGFLFAFIKILNRTLTPIMIILNSLPRIALGPLFVLWFGLGLMAKVMMVISVVFFIIFFNTYSGITEVDRDIINNARLLGASRRNLLTEVYLPSTLVWIISSLRISVGLSLIGAIVGEYIGASEGMGWVISYAESMFNSTGVMAGLFVLMITVGIIDYFLKGIEKRALSWKRV